jgi:hypothetical protein
MMSDVTFPERPTVGQEICDCRFNHQRIVSVDTDDNDTVTLEDGSSCSYYYCCDSVAHEWSHNE